VSGTLDDLYLIWLYEQVGDVKVRSRNRTYWDLFRQLYSIEFIWFIPNDDNRAEDGEDLREQFLEDRGWIFSRSTRTGWGLAVRFSRC
jgi:hypothetical protein